jgi:tetrapyrrole methylase family protein/MazG family protein
MVNFNPKDKYDINDLIKIMDMLRSENGCPWDREQTHQTIRRNFIEEVYEACEAIDLKDNELLTEELGDVLLQVVFHAQMAKEEGAFDFDDVADGICKKLIVRHPHVFGDLKLKTGSADEVLGNWEDIKNSQKNKCSNVKAVDMVAKSLPALMRAEKVLSRAARAGYDIQKAAGSVQKTPPEPADGQCAQDAQELIGDMLFATVAAARSCGVDPENALNEATERFIEKFLRENAEI